jgi:hypothetical protein
MNSKVVSITITTFTKASFSYKRIRSISSHHIYFKIHSNIISPSTRGYSKRPRHKSLPLAPIPYGNIYFSPLSTADKNQLVFLSCYPFCNPGLPSLFRWVSEQYLKIGHNRLHTIQVRCLIPHCWNSVVKQINSKKKYGSMKGVGQNRFWGPSSLLSNRYQGLSPRG